MQPELNKSFSGHASVRFTTGSSGLLARQIAQGAPFDVFLSADERYVTELAAGGHVDPESVRLYAFGRIALWSKTGAIHRLADLANSPVRHVSIANPQHAPYGRAARQALEKAGLWKLIEPRIIYAENVRQALQYAESGNAEVCITAWSLVLEKGGILIPADRHEPIRQAGGVVQSSRRAALGRELLAFLLSEEGRRLLTRYGFSPPGPSDARDRKRQ